MSVATVKRGYRQSRDYPEQVNSVSQLDICFIMYEDNMFINKDADAQYIAFR